MSLSNIRKADLIPSGGFTKSVSGTYRGWEYHVEGLTGNRYRVSVFILTDEESIVSDQGVWLTKPVICSGVTECREFIRDEVYGAPLTVKEATALSRKHGGSLMIDELMQLESAGDITDRLNWTISKRNHYIARFGDIMLTARTRSELNSKINKEINKVKNETTD